MIQKKSHIEKIILIVLSVVAILFFMIPIFWLITTSLKFGRDAFQIPPQWLFFEATLKNFREVLAVDKTFMYIKNSIINFFQSRINYYIRDNNFIFASWCSCRLRNRKIKKPICRKYILLFSITSDDSSDCDVNSVLFNYEGFTFDRVIYICNFIGHYF